MTTDASSDRPEGFPASLLNKVVKLTAIPPHMLDVVFADGAFGKHDMSDEMNQSAPILEPLKDAAYFARAFLRFGAPTWPNGYDMCADWLRMEMEKAGEIRKPVAAE